MRLVVIRLFLFCIGLCPAMLWAQTGIGKDGTITIGLGKKKTEQADTTQNKQPVYEDEYEVPANAKKERRHTNSAQDEVPDFKRDGVFKGLFHAGINGCQVDGDNYWGFKYPGFDGGVGALVRFHPLLSVSMELNYTMKGAKQSFVVSPNDSSRGKFMIQWDYVEVPVSLNIHCSKVIWLSAGLAPAVMVRYKQQSENGQDQTSNPPLGQQPRRFDLSGFGMVSFVIKKHFGLGLKYSYSTIPIRDSYFATRIKGQRNNVITLRFTYILDAVKKK